MRLRKFRVRAYRCIHDSGEITVGDLAAFVGRNESGKTTILQALTLLNRDEEVSELDLCDEMNEELKERIDSFINEKNIIEQGIFNWEYISKLKTDFYNGKKEYETKLWYVLMFQMWYAKWM